MPNIFKALASLSAWGLFVLGWFIIVINVVMGAIGGEYFNPAKVPSAEMGLFAGLGVASVVLAVVVMRLRQKME
jgi:hypothetical protein